MDKVPDEFKELLELFVAHKVEFLMRETHIP